MAMLEELDPDAALLQERVERFHAVRDGILSQVRQVIVGQDEVLAQILIGLFVGGRCLVTCLPGWAKTLLVETLAQTLGVALKHSQCTPDVRPSGTTRRA